MGRGISRGSTPLALAPIGYDLLGLAGLWSGIGHAEGCYITPCDCQWKMVYDALVGFSVKPPSAEMLMMASRFVINRSSCRPPCSALPHQFCKCGVRQHVLDALLAAVNVSAM